MGSIFTYRIACETQLPSSFILANWWFDLGLTLIWLLHCRPYFDGAGANLVDLVDQVVNEIYITEGRRTLKSKSKAQQRNQISGV